MAKPGNILIRGKYVTRRGLIISFFEEGNYVDYEFKYYKDFKDYCRENLVPIEDRPNAQYFRFVKSSIKYFVEQGIDPQAIRKQGRPKKVEEQEKHIE